MDLSEPNHIDKFILTILPAIVKDLPRLNGLKPDELYEKIREECDFDISDDAKTTDETTNIDDDLSAIQNMKIGLHNLFAEVKRELFNELRSTIKLELLMEVRMEINAAINDKNTLPVPRATPTTNTFPAFSTKKADNSDLTTKTPQPKPENSLENNPLFKLVNKNIDRLRSGQSAYTADELIEARNNRFDLESIEKFNKRVVKFNEENDDSEDSNDEQWNMMLRMREEK